MTNDDIAAALQSAGYHAEVVAAWDFVHVWSATVPRGWLTVELHADDREWPLMLCLGEPEAMWPMASLDELLREVPRALATWRPAEGQS